MGKQYHGMEFSLTELLPSGVGIYLDTERPGHTREEFSLTTGYSRTEFGELAGRAARLHRLMTGQEMSLSEAEQHILAKMARACRFQAKRIFDGINDRLDDREREHAECLRRAAEREQARAGQESLDLADPIAV